MAKQKKKRNKVYRGADSKLVTPKVIKVEAANRSKVGQYMFERKKFAKPITIAASILFLIILVLYFLVDIIFFR